MFWEMSPFTFVLMVTNGNGTMPKEGIHLNLLTLTISAGKLFTFCCRASTEYQVAVFSISTVELRVTCSARG